MNPAQREEGNQCQYNLPTQVLVHQEATSKSLPISTATRPEIVINAVYSLASAEGHDQSTAVTEQASCVNTMKQNLPILPSSRVQASEHPVLAGQELVSGSPATILTHNKSAAGSSCSVNVNSSSVDPAIKSQNIQNLPFLSSDSKEISTISKGNDSLAGLLESNINVTEIYQVKKDQPPVIVDLETEDIDDCMLIKIDLSKRVCKFGPVFSGEVVVEDSDEEVGSNKMSSQSSEFEMRSSERNLGTICGEKIVPKSSETTSSVSHAQAQREQSPTLDMEVENIKEEVCEESVTSDNEDVTTEQPDIVSCAETQLVQPQRIASAESNRYDCKPCSKSFPNRTSLVTHILACHMTKPPPKELLEKFVYPCQNCSQLFKSDSLLVNHECSSCHIKSNLSTQNNPAMPSSAKPPTLKNVLNKTSTKPKETILKAQQVITPVVTSAPSGHFDTNASVTALIAVKKEIQEMDEGENLSLSSMKEKELKVPKNIPKETPVTKTNQSHKTDTEAKKKDSSIGATNSAANVTADKSNQKEPLKPKGGEKTVWCYACDSWFTTYTELKLHLKIKPQCKVTNDEFYLQNVKNNPYRARTSCATRATTDNKSQPAKSSDATASSVTNKPNVPGNDKLVTVAKPDSNLNEDKKSEQKPKLEPLKIKIGPAHCFTKQKRVSAQAANLPSEDNPHVDDVMETKRNLCKEGSNDISTAVNSIKFEAGQNGSIDKKLNRAVVQLKSTSAMCKVCQKAFIDEQTLMNHLQNAPKCLSSNKEAEQCKSCKCWFYNSDSLRKHVLMSESCQVGTSKEIATDNLPSDPINVKVDQQTLSGYVKIDLSSDDSDDVEVCSSEESDVEYKCRHCTMVFAQKSQCKKHMKTSHGQQWQDTNSTEKCKKMRCKSCTRKFDNITRLQAHLLQNKFCFLAMTYCFWNSVQNENHVCLLCTKIFPSDQLLRRHCFKNMACRLSYTSQVLKELGNDSTSSPVPDTKVVTNNSPVEGNKMLPMRNEGVPKPVVAEVSSSVQDLNVSSSVSATPNTLKQPSHSGSSTTRNANKVCKSCGAYYVTFIDHVLKEDACCAYYASHMEESPTVSFCFRCKKQFQNKRLFKFHLCSNASGEMREAEACTIGANKNLTSQLSGANLIHTTHVSSPEEFTCMICQIKFPILRQLQEHSYQHTDLISHVCQRCNMSFRHYNQVVSHMAFHIRMDKESESVSKQAVHHPSNSAKAELSSVSDSQSLNTEAAQDHSCPVCLQLFKSKEAVEDHKKKHEISKTSSKKNRLVNVHAGKLDPLPATEKDIMSEFPQLCGCCNKNLNSSTDKRKHISCSARCRKALSNLNVKKEKKSEDEDNDSGKNNSSIQNHNSCLPSKGSVKCMFCLEVFICEQDKLEHISQSQCCKSVLKFVLDNKIYATTCADSNVNSKLRYKKCEFCLKIIEDKIAHLLKSPCMKALEDAIIAYKSNTTVNISAINNQGATNRPSYSCEICKQIFGTKGSLSCHKRRKHQVEKHISISSQVSSEHLQEIPSDHHLYCFKCHCYLETENDVRMHCKLSHSRKLLSRGTMKNAVFTPGKLKCKICDIKYLGIQKGRLVNHMFLKHNQGTSKLLDLQEELLNIKNVTSSPGDASQKTTKPFPSYSVFTCTFCGMIVGHKGKNSHFQVHMNKLLKTVKRKSDVPMYAFSRETCPFCKKVYLSRKNLRIHLLQHTANDIVNPRSKPGTYKMHSGLIKCFVCKRFFSSRNTLKHHALTTHKKIFLEDPLIFGIKSSITANKAKKTGLKIKNPASYQCDICSQVFNNKSTFKFHKMFHGESSTMLEDSNELTPNEPPALSHRSTDVSHMIPHMIPKQVRKVAILKNRKVAVRKKIKIDESGTNMIMMTSDEGKDCSVNKSSHHKTENETCRVECWKGFSLRPPHKAILNCHLCEVKIRKDGYLDHLLNDHKCREETIHGCSFCDLKFPTSGLAEEHLKQCSLDSQCILCLEQLQSIKLLKNHVVQGHKHTWSDYISKFGVSTKIGIDNGGLKIASTSTEIESMYSPRTCPICQATFNEKSTYICHLEEHTKTCTVSLPKLDENLRVAPKPDTRDKTVGLSAPSSLPSVSSGSVQSDGSASNLKVFQSHVSGYFKLTLKSEKPDEVPNSRAEQHQGASDSLENEGLTIKQHKKDTSISKSSKVVKARKRAVITSSSSEDDCGLPKAIKLSPSEQFNSSGTFNEEI